LKRTDDTHRLDPGTGSAPRFGTWKSTTRHVPSEHTQRKILKFNHVKERKKFARVLCLGTMFDVVGSRPG
jgi:hypothetical protein